MKPIQSTHITCIEDVMTWLYPHYAKDCETQGKQADKEGFIQFLGELGLLDAWLFGKNETTIRKHNDQQPPSINKGRK